MTGSRVHQAVPFFSVLAALSFAEDEQRRVSQRGSWTRSRQTVCCDSRGWKL